MLGKSYIIDHCIQYLKKTNEDRIFRLYVTDALKIITKNTSLLGGTYIEESYNDIISGNTAKKEDADPEEIKDRIRSKLAKIENGKEEGHGFHGTESQVDAR